MSLVPDLTDRSGFLQVELEGAFLAFKNRMPGVGLATDVFDIELTVIDEYGRAYDAFATRFPQFKGCKALKFFPGEESQPIKLPFDPAALPRGSRLLVRLWVGGL